MAFLILHEDGLQQKDWHIAFGLLQFQMWYCASITSDSLVTGWVLMNASMRNYFIRSLIDSSDVWQLALSQWNYLLTLKPWNSSNTVIKEFAVTVTIHREFLTSNFFVKIKTFIVSDTKSEKVDDFFGAQYRKCSLFKHYYYTILMKVSQQKMFSKL